MKEIVDFINKTTNRQMTLTGDAEHGFSVEFDDERLVGLNRKFATEDDVKDWLTGMLTCILIQTMADAEKEAQKRSDAAIRAARRQRTADFNPWKFVGKDKIRPALMGCFLHDGKLAASDTHVLLVLNHYEYDEKYEGKIVDVDLNEINGIFPKYESVIPDVDNDETFEVFENMRDWSFFDGFSKMRKSDVNTMIRVGKCYFSQEAAGRIGLFLKKFNDATVYLSAKKMQMVIKCEDALLLVMGMCVDEDEIKAQISKGESIVVE